MLRKIVIRTVVGKGKEMEAFRAYVVKQVIPSIHTCIPLWDSYLAPTACQSRGPMAKIKDKQNTLSALLTSRLLCTCMCVGGGGLVTKFSSL